jgi:hypothetical protein
MNQNDETEVDEDEADRKGREALAKKIQEVAKCKKFSIRPRYFHYLVN